MSEVDLYPCPFCGSKNAPRMMTRHGKNGWRDRYYVICDYADGGCGSSSGWYHNVVEAESCWNTRLGKEDAVPVVHGYWTTKRTLTHDGEWYCSNCEYEPTVFEEYSYCPNCGAKMDEERREKNDQA